MRRFGRLWLWVAWIGLLIAVVHPPRSLGVSMCWTRALTGVPCPGCRMTRALSCAARGMVEESWHHHAFGLPLFVLFAFTAAVSLLPVATRTRFTGWLESHDGPMMVAYVVSTSTFVAFGAVRSLVHLLG